MLERGGGLARLFARLSSGIKMLIIMTTALLPLGLIALLASIDSARNNRLQHEADARVMAESGARQIGAALRRSSRALRTALAQPPATPEDCRARLDALDQADGQPIAYALTERDGRVRCASGAWRAGVTIIPPVAGRLSLVGQPPLLRFAVPLPGRAGYGVGEVPVAALQRMAELATADHALAVTDGRIVLSISDPRLLRDEPLSLSAPIAGGLRLLVAAHVSAISATEVLLVLLPMLMWLAAALIGWIVVDRLVLRPLGQLQRAIAHYDPASGPFAVPRFASPSTEIRALGESFAGATQLIERHEAGLEAGLVAQKKLVREVHHRVKNNLQVIASLINLHARGASSDAADAYSSIQRRVDALAVVYRNHFAELEENRGISLRALIGELVANLRATAPAGAGGMTVTLDVIPAIVVQDIAVPVSFMLTEIIELVMNCDPQGAIVITVARTAPGRARLCIRSPGLTEARCAESPLMERFTRVVTGLSRQLRAPLEIDAGEGEYAIAIPLAETEKN